MEFESNIIGCLLIKPELIKEICIPIEAFKSQEARISLKIIADQYSKIKSVSLVGIADIYKDFFKDNNEAKMVTNYLYDCLNTQAVAAHFEYYQEKLFNSYIESEIMRTIKSYQREEVSTEEMLEKIHQLETIVIKPKNNCLSGEELYKIIKRENKRINFRFEKLTERGNIQEHDLVILAARPGVGKTAFALNLLDDLSSKYNCIYFNMEMSEQQVYRRLVSLNSKISTNYLEKPATSYQEDKIKECCNVVAKKKFKVITSSQTIKTIKSRIIKESSNEHTIVFIDYVGLIRGIQKNQSIYERVTDITKELRQISLDYNCTIFLIAQINRNSDKNKNKSPQISDLKESGELEQSGTAVLMLHNDDMFSSEDVANIQLIIGKNRNGGVGIINLNYDKTIQRFEEKKRG